MTAWWRRGISWPLLFFAAVLAGLQGCSEDDEQPRAEREQVVARPELPPPQELPVPASTNQSVPPPAPAPAPPPGTCTGPAGRTLRTLVIGNSQIYFWDLPRILSELSWSAPPACPRIVAEPFTRGGQNLERLWLGGDSLGRDLATTISVGRYDVVLIAESIGLVELDPPHEPFTKFANIIIDAARASGAVPVLYATPYADQPEHWGFQEMATPQLALGAARSVRVATGGLAWLRVWREQPELDLHHPDHAHPGYSGSVISAMVIYSAITGATPVGLTPPNAFECYRGACVPPLTNDELLLFQRAAWDEAQLEHSR